MPSKSPPIGDDLTFRLKSLGEHIRARREREKVSAVSAAEAAGVSRVTLHRIERGEPSVTMGAYLSVIDAVGLQLALIDPLAVPAQGASPALPSTVRLADHPQLHRLAWQLQGVAEVTPAEALSLYERNWRHVDTASLLPTERALIDALTSHLGRGRLLV